MRSPAGRLRVLADGLVMLAVAAASLFLLFYVGYGEAARVYPRLLQQKTEAEGELLRSAMSAYLQAGLPLRQYVGFNTLAGPMLAADPTIARIAVADHHGRAVFAVGTASADAEPVSLSLKNQFEEVGELTISVHRGVIEERLRRAFRPLLALGALLSLGFAGFAVASHARPRLLQLGYAVAFTAMAGALIWALVALYAEGAQAKAGALAQSLGHRVGALLELGLSLDDVAGLDRTFADYRRLNPDILAAGLMVDAVARIHTDPQAVGRPWRSGGGAYDFVVPLAGGRSSISVAVALPAELVWRQVGRSVKNFAALFLASALLAGLFLQLAAGTRGAGRGGTVGAGDDHAIKLVAPAFFLAVFTDQLLYPFLPKLLQDLAVGAGLGASFASTMFMIYFLCFALSLIPAGQLATRHGPKPLMIWGAGGMVVSMLLMAFWHGLAGVMLARGLAGLAQGTLFIGTQTFLLAVASPARTTQAAVVIVTGFQGAAIAGAAMGSLLVLDLGPTGIFLLGAAIGLGLMLYVGLLLPAVAGDAPLGRRVGSVASLIRDIGRALTDREMLKTMMTVGVPAKAVLTGVIVFALPLLLGQHRFSQEDIGQIIMLYGIGVMLASGPIARLVDRSGATTAILFAGSLLAAVGLAAIGLVGFAEGPRAIVVLVASVILVGLAHGCVNAPVITHLANSTLAQRIGGGKATAAYRFLERLGHIGGPVIAGQLLARAGGAPVVLAWIGGGLAVLAVLFLLPLGRRPVDREAAA